MNLRWIISHLHLHPHPCQHSQIYLKLNVCSIIFFGQSTNILQDSVSDNLFNAYRFHWFVTDWSLLATWPWPHFHSPLSKILRLGLFLSIITTQMTVIPIHSLSTQSSLSVYFSWLCTSRPWSYFQIPETFHNVFTVVI